MNYWKDNGAPADKLMLGFPTYGNTFTLRNPANHGVGAPTAGAGTPGKYTQEAGELAYFEVCDCVLYPSTLADLRYSLYQEYVRMRDYV